MDNDTAAIILTVLLAVGAAYAALAHKLSSFGERLARIEGIMEGWLTPPPPKSPPGEDVMDPEAMVA